MNIFNSPRLRERTEGLNLLKELTKDKSKCFIIHYSCESFITTHGKTPRVTSICIRNLNSSQTISFSIHLQAQFEGKDFNNLSDAEYDELELKMLNEFSEFVKKHSTYKWIHWNMRDSNYGFVAINNRIKILGGLLFEIPDELKFDFPRIISLIYTHGYEKHQPKGRLLNLADRNNISSINALTGAEEAQAFDEKEYLKLHISTLSKVDIIDSIISNTETEKLRVVSTKQQIYGLTLPGILAIIKETPWLLLVASILGYITNIVLEPIIQKLFHTGAEIK
jgi:hypothetical protein